MPQNLDLIIIQILFLIFGTFLFDFSHFSNIFIFLYSYADLRTESVLVWKCQTEDASIAHFWQQSFRTSFTSRSAQKRQGKKMK